MIEADQIGDFLQKLPPLSRCCLLSELERLELSGIDMPGSEDIQARLRAEFRQDGSTEARAISPARCFFAPLEPVLMDGAPDHANAGRISRNALTPIWEWICRDLLPTMARDYVAAINDQVTANKPKDVLKTAAAFQVKVAKVLENTLASADGTEIARGKLAQYTASRTAFGDAVKMLTVLRTSAPLAAFNEKLPATIGKLDEKQAAKLAALLDELRKSHPDALPFALALIAQRLKTVWHLIRFASRTSASKSAADIARSPYAITLCMVLDRLDDRRLALRVALKTNRVLVARDLIAEIYDIEHALKVNIDGLEQSEWGHRLQTLMDAIEALVAAEVSRFPDNVGHIFGSRRRRGNYSLTERLGYLALKSRDAMQDGASVFRKLIGQAPV